MKQIVENIRRKPTHQQNRFIMIIVVTTAVILVTLWAIIGIPGKTNPNSKGDLINEVNQQYNDSKTMLPDLFPKN